MGDEDKKPSVWRDLDRLTTFTKRAAMLGAIVALICHHVPPRYKVVCDRIMHVCTLGAH